MLASEIRELSQDDIQTRIRDLEEEQFRLKFRSASEPLEDPLRLRVIRKDIARLRTVLKEKNKGTNKGTNTSARTKSAAGR
jgi:large subunit ribosomal protein L29